MSNQKHFPGTSEYFIKEGEARILLDSFGSDDHLALERIEFKENFLNDLYVRMADADLKIKLLSNAKEKYENEKRKTLSAEVSLECSFIDAALQNNILEIAEIIAEFIMRIRNIFPSLAHLFRKNKKALANIEKTIQEKYSQSRKFLFPDLIDANTNGKVPEVHFKTLAMCLETKSQPMLKFRDKILAHKYDKERFITYLSLEQYSSIKNEFEKILNAIVIVASLSLNDLDITRTKEEIERTRKWLLNGLIASAPITQINKN